MLEESRAGVVSSIEVGPLQPDEAPVLAALLQLYRYDFSEFRDDDVGADGRYAVAQFQLYVSDAGHMSYLVRMEGQLVGFVILRRCDAVDGRGPVTDVAHFFVMRKYRRRGIGEEAATSLFDRYAGTWQVGERPNNFAAQAFWRAIIGRYSGGKFEELPGDEAIGPTQFFLSRGEVQTEH
jgi:predicted acetyltransferase